MKTLRLTVLFLGLMLQALSAHADTGLTKAEVRQYLVLAIELGHLQDRLIRQADQHQDLPLAYRTQGQTLLQAKGSNWRDYEALQQRISNARTVLDDKPDWPKEIAEAEANVRELCQSSAEPLIPLAEQQQMIAMLKASGASESEIAKVKATLSASDEQSSALCQAAKAAKQSQLEVQAQLTAQTEKDWAAVQAYRPELRALVEWRARNRSTPPKL